MLETDLTDASDDQSSTNHVELGSMNLRYRYDRDIETSSSYSDLEALDSPSTVTWVLARLSFALGDFLLRVLSSYKVWFCQAVLYSQFGLYLLFQNDEIARILDWATTNCALAFFMVASYAYQRSLRPLCSLVSCNGRPRWSRGHGLYKYSLVLPELMLNAAGLTIVRGQPATAFFLLVGFTVILFAISILGMIARRMLMKSWL